MKRRYLNERIEESMILLVLTLAGFALFTLLVIMVYGGHYSLYLIWLLFVLVFIVIGSRFHKGVIEPFKSAERKLKNYHLGHDSEALGHMEVFYSEHLEKTILKFIQLFDTMNAIKLTNTHAEYRALQNQINPHFLYNTLEAIRSDALCEGVEDIAVITESLAKFFRYTISNVNSLVTLEEEIINAENYFAIQNYRFGDRIQLRVLTPEDESSFLKLRIPKLTLQPIIENAIIHGLEHKVGKGMIEISFETTEDRLLITITDDGVGMSEECVDEINEKLAQIHMDTKGKTETHKGGVALVNVNNRLKLQFGEKYGLLLTSVQNYGTRVEIVCPLKVSAVD